MSLGKDERVWESRLRASRLCSVTGFGLDAEGGEGSDVMMLARVSGEGGW